MSGVIYHGSSSDGWDAREMKGVYLSPDGEHWGTTPYTEEQIQAEREYQLQERMYKAVQEHLDKEGHSFDEEIELIKEKKSKLSCRLREFCVSLQRI